MRPLTRAPRQRWPRLGVHVVGEIERRRALVAGRSLRPAGSARRRGPRTSLPAGAEQVGLRAVAAAPVRAAAAATRSSAGSWPRPCGLPCTASAPRRRARRASCISCVRICTSSGSLPGPDHGRVQRAVVVVLGRGDVVVELAGDVRPPSVHEAERRVAVGNGIDHDPHREHVHDLLELQRLALHLAPDAVDVLRAARDLAGDACGRQRPRRRSRCTSSMYRSRSPRFDSQPAGDAACIPRVGCSGTPGPPVPT